MIGHLLTDKQGKILTQKSLYSPPREISELTARIRQDYQTGYDNNHRTYREFNDRTLRQTIDDSQKKFNQYIEPKSQDPSERWRFNGIRPMTRNKVISMAAHVVVAMLYPKVFAQNDKDEEDQKASEVMRDLIEWNIRNSNYKMSFIYGVITGLVNPVVYLQSEFSEVIQKIRLKDPNGNMVTKEVIDEVLSGLQTYLIPVDEILIANPYEYHLQRQRFIIRRRYIDYEEAKSLYGEHSHFKYIRPGVKVLYDSGSDSFYEMYDDTLNNLVEEVVYKNRQEDIEIPFINGVYFGADSLFNPIKHRRIARTKDGEYITVPLYNIAKSGFEPIDEMRFFFYKSLVEKLSPDQDLLDIMWRLTADGTFLQVMPPTAVSGDETITSSVMFPGKVSVFAKDTKVQEIGPKSNLVAAYNAVQAIEQSMERSSQDDVRSGIDAGGNKTAFEISQLQQNARINLTMFGNMVAQLVTDFGMLLIDNIIRHQTVGQAFEMLGGSTQFKFATFNLPEQNIQGKNMTKRIKFTDTLFGKEFTEDDFMRESKRISDERGGLDSNMWLIEVNPELFAKMKYKVIVDADSLMPKNDAFDKAMKLEAYDRMIQNPLIMNDPESLEAVTRDFLIDVFAKGEADKYLPKDTSAIMAQINGALEGEEEGTSPLVKQITGTNSLKALSGGA